MVYRGGSCRRLETMNRGYMISYATLPTPLRYVHILHPDIQREGETWVLVAAFIVPDLDAAKSQQHVRWRAVAETAPHSPEWKELCSTRGACLRQRGCVRWYCRRTISISSCGCNAGRLRSRHPQSLFRLEIYHNFCVAAHHCTLFRVGRCSVDLSGASGWLAGPCTCGGAPSALQKTFNTNGLTVEYRTVRA